MKAGPLRHRILIQRPVKKQDPNTGAIIDLWENVQTRWAEVVALSARDFIAAKSFQSEVTTRIKIRYCDWITSGYRVLFRGKVFNIEGVLPDPDSGLEYLTLPCSEGVNDG